MRQLQLLIASKIHYNLRRLTLLNASIKYNWQLPNWGKFIFDDSIIDSLSMNFALETGELKGLVDSLSTEIQEETILQFMISEAIKTLLLPKKASIKI
jgi:Domain of unknown function (DUF4172)